MANTKPSFKDIQYAFTAHIRDPEHVPCPSDVEDRRMKIYRDLFYNNIEGFIANAFPVLKSLYSEKEWHALVRDFFINYKASTPYFPEIAQEFIAYLQSEPVLKSAAFPFQLELAHYEWVELAISIADDSTSANIDASGNLMTNIPVLSSTAWILAYTYPVHQISPEFQPTEPSSQPTFLVVYRNQQFQVRFIEINGITANLMQSINDPDNNQTGEQLLRTLAKQLPNMEEDAVLEFGSKTLDDLHDKGIIVGTRAA